MSVDGKSVKRSQLSADEFRLHEALSREKALTADFYSRMSGEEPWGTTTRESLMAQFEALAGEIDAIQRKRNADWFAALPGACCTGQKIEPSAERPDRRLPSRARRRGPTAPGTRRHV
jgi:hypothetical protein